MISQPDTGEQALEIADMLVRSNAVDVLVIDSVVALVPGRVEGDMGDTHVGLQARLMSQALRKPPVVSTNPRPLFSSSIRSGSRLGSCSEIPRQRQEAMR